MLEWVFKEGLCWDPSDKKDLSRWKSGDRRSRQKFLDVFQREQQVLRPWGRSKHSVHGEGRPAWLKQSEEGLQWSRVSTARPHRASQIKGGSLSPRAMESPPRVCSSRQMWLDFIFKKSLWLWYEEWTIGGMHNGEPGRLIRWPGRTRSQSCYFGQRRQQRWREVDGFWLYGWGVLKKIP